MDFLGWGPSKAAKKLGIDRKSVYRYLEGSGWTRHTQAKMARGLGMTQTEFLDGPPNWPGSEQSKEDRQSILSTRGGLVDVPFYVGVPEFGLATEANGTYAVPLRDGGPDRCAMEVTDDGMAPRIRPGDIVLLDTERTRPKSRDVVAVKVDGETHLAIWIIRDREVVLTWLNGRWPEMEIADPSSVTVIGTAVKIVAGEL